jgi:hypothetical protein
VILEGLFPLKRHLPHRLQFLQDEDQNQEDTLVSENENNLGFEMLSSSQSSEIDQKINDFDDVAVTESPLAAKINTTPQRSVQPNKCDTSPSATDSILSEIDQGVL